MMTDLLSLYRYSLERRVGRGTALTEPVVRRTALFAAKSGEPSKYLCGSTAYSALRRSRVSEFQTRVKRTAALIDGAVQMKTSTSSVHVRGETEQPTTIKSASRAMRRLVVRRLPSRCRESAIAEYRTGNFACG